MLDNLNKKVLLIGAGQMAVDYCNILKAMQCQITVVGRGEKSALAFAEKTGIKVISGGLETFLINNTDKYDAVIIAVGVEQLSNTAIQLIDHGFNYILIEKPAGLNEEEISKLGSKASQKNAQVLLAYNRRTYASVLKAKEIIEQDGGVTSFNFEFTEWAHTIEPLEKKPGVKENWLLANSTHVIDLAFYLGGKPEKINCYTAGKLSWHDKAIFSGAGKTSAEVLFSYQANWNAPGRWGVEILTNKSRLILKPMEELQIQLKGSVAINKIEIDDSLDKQFKPGLFQQTHNFLNKQISEFITVEEQVKMVRVYSMIAKGNI